MVTEVQIPKTIHYCWFGGNPLSELARKCINSWKKYLPDYEIVEWNETNFDISVCKYVKDAYVEKKWAFVSDYARFWILYHYGGIYFDTDVEILQNMDHIIAKGPFMGIEKPGFVAPGLGIGAVPGMEVFKVIIEYYKTIPFCLTDGSNQIITVVKYTTDILKEYGFSGEIKIHNIAGLTIYPPEYFCPLNDDTGVLCITDNTVTIHHFAASWKSRLDSLITKIERCKKGNQSIEYKIRRGFSFPFRCINYWKKHGFHETRRFAIEKIKRKK